ncbi:phage virion morphogenesis protein [Yersinia mollaretii]|uniref:phage virion morphogenesis protein n=1 Tax=Yersinia mollaretii TaxID=33060 RepID=UPI0009BAB280
MSGDSPPDRAELIARGIYFVLRASVNSLERNILCFDVKSQACILISKNADEAAVTFSGKVNNLVRVHHYGLRDKVSRNGPTVKYERRQLLGFTDGDSEWIGDLVLEYIAK